MRNQKPLIDGGPLARIGASLIDNGYSIIPIAVGKKAPGFDGWQKARSTKQQLVEWVENGHAFSGVGILTRDTPAIDLDIRDEKLALEAEAKVREIFGDSPVRIGNAPKRLMMFRTDKPFRKMRSAKYKDEWGDLHQIEILGDGQQFVAYHTHPDTCKPYLWPEEKISKDGETISAGGPRTISSDELPFITEEQCKELIEWFEERVSQEADFVKVKSARSMASGSELDDAFAEDTRPIEISEDELRSRLMLVPGSEDHDIWFQVGMALYHQFDGDEIGMDLWNEWSETADNYDKDMLERRWATFDIDGKKRAPITARYILRLSADAVVETTAALSIKLRTEFSEAKTRIEWDKAVAHTREAEIDHIARASLIDFAKERLDNILGTKTPRTAVQKALAYSPTKTEKTPGWVSPFVYDTTDDRFFSTESKISTTQQGFNAMFDRKAMSKKDVLDGKSSPSSTASALALNLHKITIVNGRRYEPGRDPIFYSSEGVFANTYPEHEIPETPDTLLPRDKRAIRLIKDHIKHLLVKPVEQRMFLDWLCWIVQNPGKHVNYAILLQGVEGDGKSFFGMLMRAVMGVSNVRMMNAHILESSFTDWAVGQCLACIEEVRLIKHANKYEIINRIKPFITNSIIEVHPKGSKQYDAKNTTSYLMFSNYRDALPIDDDGRRYLVLFSQWQSKVKLQAFKDENPEYYEDLYRTLEECAPALRQWMLEHEFDPTFKPLGDAPTTDARKYMVRQAQPEFIQNLHDLIAENEVPGLSDELVSLTELADTFVSRGLDLPANKAMGSMLSRYGFESIGRIKYNGELVTFCSKTPEMFQYFVNGELYLDTEKVRKFMNSRKSVQDDDDEL